jgi:hypothetical protein
MASCSAWCSSIAVQNPALGVFISYSPPAVLTSTIFIVLAIGEQLLSAIFDKPRAGEPDAGFETKTLPVHLWSGRYGYRRCRSVGAQIVCRGFSGPPVSDNLKSDFLALAEAVQPCAFDRADVHEYILAAVIGLDKAKALLVVEPLYCSLRHETFSRYESG